MKITIPTSLDLNKLFESDQLITYTKRVKRNKKLTAQEFTVPLRTLKQYIPSCQLLLHYICEKYLTGADEKEYINLSSSVLDKKMGREPRTIARDILTQLNILKFNDTYKPKFFPQSYRIYTQHLESGYCDIEVSQHAGITTWSSCNSHQVSQHVIQDIPGITTCSIGFSEVSQHEVHANADTISNIYTKGITTCNSGYDKEDRYGYKLIDYPYVVIPHYKYQRDTLNKIVLDSPGANLYLLNLTSYDPDYTAKKYNKALKQLDRIKQKEFYFKTKNASNRIFHNFNNIKKELRYYFKDANGNTMHELDFSASHVAHLIKAVLDDFRDDKVNAQINKECLISEANAFRGMVESGDVYTIIGNKYFNDHRRDITKNYNRSRKYKDRKDGRSIVKELVLVKWLNGYGKGRGNDIKWLRSKYPNITAFIDSINADDRRSLSRRLQTSESYLLHDIIVGRISKECSDSIMYTVHDSVIVEPKYANEVYSIMCEEVSKYFPFTAQVTNKGEIKNPCPGLESLTEKKETMDKKEVKPDTDQIEPSMIKKVHAVTLYKNIESKHATDAFEIYNRTLKFLAVHEFCKGLDGYDIAIDVNQIKNSQRLREMDKIRLCTLLGV